MNSAKVRSVFEIVCADLLWGIGFIGTVWCLQSFTISQSLLLRFGLVTIICMPFVFWVQKKFQILYFLKKSFLPSIFLFAELFFQVMGLKYTTAAKAGFITVLFIVIVPLIERIIFSKKVSHLHWIWVIMSLVGIKFIVGGTFLSSFQYGDAIVLVSCFFASLHIITIGKQSLESDSLFTFNLYQIFWCFLFSLPLIFVDSLSDIQKISTLSITGLIIISFGTTLLAFYFQLRAQRFLSPSMASLLFLLESPFAAFFSIYFLNENLSEKQLLGCGLVIFAAACAIYSTSLKTDQVS